MPLAVLIAWTMGGLFLMMATVASSALAQMVFGAVAALGDMASALAFDGQDPTPLVAAAGWQATKLIGAVLFLPVVITALASEMFRWPGLVAQMALTGGLAMLMPAAVLGLTRLPTGAETQVLAAFFLTGAVTGLVYWLIAGRGAFASPAAGPVSDRPASSGS
jgi:hypothetical protein